MKNIIPITTYENKDQDQRKSRRQHGKVKDCRKDYKREKESPRKEFLRKLHVASLRSHVELSFDIEGSNKPTQALSNVLSQVVDYLNKIEPNAKIILCKVAVQKLDYEKISRLARQ